MCRSSSLQPVGSPSRTSPHQCTGTSPSSAFHCPAKIAIPHVMDCYMLSCETDRLEIRCLPLLPAHAVCSHIQSLHASDYNCFACPTIAQGLIGIHSHEWHCHIRTIMRNKASMHLTLLWQDSWCSQYTSDTGGAHVLCRSELQPY